MTNSEEEDSSKDLEEITDKPAGETGKQILESQYYKKIELDR